MGEEIKYGYIVCTYVNMYSYILYIQSSSTAEIRREEEWERTGNTINKRKAKAMM